MNGRALLLSRLLLELGMFTTVFSLGALTPSDWRIGKEEIGERLRASDFRTAMAMTLERMGGAEVRSGSNEFDGRSEERDM